MEKGLGQETDRLPIASFAQRMFWLLEQIEPETPVYNLPRALLITGNLDVIALSETFRLLQARHEVLRTGFVEREGKILQQVHDNVSLPLPILDLTHVAAAERQPEALRLAAEEGCKPFDLGRAPLLRLQLLRLGAEEHLLLLVLHHIIADGWSMSVLFDEIASIYESCIRGEMPDLAALPLCYSDFARWQHEHLTEAALAPDVAYWEQNLRGCPELLELPTDRRRPAVQSHRGARHSMVVDATLTQRLKQHCGREGATLFMGLLAIFQLLLQRYSGQDDIPVGTPVAGRNDPDLAGLVGCFVNTIILRTDLSGDPSFSGLLRRVREIALEGYAHQELPFEQLLVHLKPHRNRSHAPLFQTMFILQNAPKQVARIVGVEIEELELDSGLAKFDLTLEVMEQEGGLYCSFEYSSDLFDAPTIERLAQHFITLLSAAVDVPETPISRLPLLSAAERERILVEWNRTHFDYPRDLRLDAAFEQQVRRTPEGIALVEAGRPTTFAELDQRANHIAHALVARSLPADAPVGVHLTRSVDTVAAILGILKAGLPYVPLDLAQPSARLHRLVANSGCRLVLTRGALRQALPATVETLLLDADQELWRGPQNAPPQVGAGSNLAYVVFTSGSTGEPKGVMGTHRATINRCEWMYRAYPFTAGEVCCHKTALGFVDSIFEIFGPLLRGVPNRILADEDVIDPDRLIELLAEADASRIVLVPTLLRVLLDHAPNLGARLPRLRLWSSSGEDLPDTLARRFREACPEALLLNLYGSSEVAADVTCHAVREVRAEVPVPIGKPIANAEVYILDRHLQPVPVGVPGQILVGGDCLSAGYWRRPDLTRERFLPNPFRPNAPPLFATGDQGRFLSDGSIEYLGRRDSQVKIRGYRVELGEVESHLLQHVGVRQATLSVMSEETGGSTQIVAYVAGRNGDMPPSEELRGFLRDRVPQYMVPAIFVEIGELPLLPSGKVNRAALPVPAAASARGPANDKVQPRNATEAALATIWTDLLHVPKVGVHQNFFDLGGHSLLAMQVLARIRRQFEVDVPIRKLFELPTIDRLAGEIDCVRAAGGTPRLRAIRPRPRNTVDTDALAAELGKLSPEQIELLLQQVRKS